MDVKRSWDVRVMRKQDLITISHACSTDIDMTYAHPITLASDHDAAYFLPFAVGPADGGCDFTALPSGIDSSTCTAVHGLGLTNPATAAAFVDGTHAAVCSAASRAATKMSGLHGEGIPQAALKRVRNRC